MATRWIRWSGLLILGLVVLAAGDSLAEQTATRWALSQVRSTAAGIAALRAAVLQSEIEKQRTLPFVLAQDPDVRTALTTRDPARLAALNIKLDLLSRGTRAGVIYLLDRQALAIAASNWQTPTSFIGSSYAFRPYFKDAMTDGAAERFALGTVSQRPGLYLSQRIGDPATPLGVIVVKAEFDPIEAEWRRFEEPTFATDQHTVVLLSSEPAWRFRAMEPLAPALRAEIRASQQFGDATLDAMAILPGGAGEDVVRAWLPGEASQTAYLALSVGVETTPWTLHVLAPTRGAVTLAVRVARLIAFLTGLSLLGVLGVWRSRQGRLRDERRRQHAMRESLEERVRIRTAELETANQQLIAVMDERRRAQIARQDLQDELIQASKLAVLGQIVAGVAHEINQPVAAIRLFAENSTALMLRDDVATARDNMALIAGLTEKIGSITDELRAFARKAPRGVERVSIRAVVDGALLLVGHRLRQQGIALTVDIPEADASVAADRIRLEQVLVNLLQNAIEALSERTDGHIRIEARCASDRTIIRVMDNGPGLSPLVMRSLFMPFTTTKPTGLGLGLVISHDIIVESGGSFAAENGENGAIFTINLPRPC